MSKRDPRPEWHPSSGETFGAYQARLVAWKKRSAERIEAERRILTDADGRPLLKPVRRPGEPLWAFYRRCHEHEDRVRDIGSKAFADQFRKSLREDSEPDDA